VQVHDIPVKVVKAAGAGGVEGVDEVVGVMLWLMLVEEVVLEGTVEVGTLIDVVALEVTKDIRADDVVVKVIADVGATAVLIHEHALETIDASSKY
jgi:hypothetical protein